MAAAPVLRPERLHLRPFTAATAPQLRLQAELRRQGSILQIRWILSGQLEDLRLPEPVAEPSRRDELWTSSCLECFLARPLDAGYWELNLSPCGDWNLYRLDGYRQGLRPEAAIQLLPSQRRLSVLGNSASDAGGASDSGDPGDAGDPNDPDNPGDPGSPADAGGAGDVGGASDSAGGSIASAGGTVGADQSLEQAQERAQKHTSGQALELSLELDLQALLGAEAATAALELGVTAVLEEQDGQLSYWALRHPAAEADFHDRAGFVVRLPAAGGSE